MTRDELDRQVIAILDKNNAATDADDVIAALRPIIEGFYSKKWTKATQGKVKPQTRQQEGGKGRGK